MLLLDDSQQKKINRTGIFFQKNTKKQGKVSIFGLSDNLSLWFLWHLRDALIAVGRQRVQASRQQ